MKSPQRGEVWIVDLGMVAKVRPALVLSVPALNQDRSLVALVPHTTSVRGSRFEVKIAVRFLKEGAFDAQNLLTVPHAKLQHRLGSLKADELVQVEAAVKEWLGLG
jgi:mRNA interferase MazF